MNRTLNALYPVALAAGLAGITGAAMAASRHHPVALAMTLLIAAFFAIGVWELTAFRRDSRGLAVAVERDVNDDWLNSVPVALRAAVQQRLDGLRVVLPGLALTPALSGLLVLLGMLGTFIGLLITLSSTASALGASADLAALRAALGAPVQGLGLAFSASVAGVAGSAMLGLMVALSRRERAAAVARLDTAILRKLRPLTSAHRREVELQAMNAAAAELARSNQLELANQLQQFTERIAAQLSSQNGAFHDETSKAYAALASSVDTTLRGSLAAAAREAGAAIQPAAEAVMAGIAREAAALHERVGSQVTEQLGALSSTFEAGAVRIAQQHEAAALAQAAGLSQHREAALKFLADAGVAAECAVELQGQRWSTDAQTLLSAIDAMATRHQAVQVQADQSREASLQRHFDALAEQRDSALAVVAQTAEQFVRQTHELLERVSETHARHQAVQTELDGQRRIEASADAHALSTQREAIEQLLATQREEGQQLLVDSTDRVQAALTEMTGLFAKQTEAAISALVEAFSRLQSSHGASDEKRLEAWRSALESAGATQLTQQRKMADGLLSHTQDLVTQAEGYSQRTLSEAGALLQAAGEAPRAAVEVVSALREQLVQSQAQDRAALVERAELMQTVSTLLASLQQAAGDQRAVIDALVNSSASQLQDLGQRFTSKADATGQALAEAASTLAVSAADIASVGEGFSEAVEQFQGANTQLVQHLARLEDRLSASMARSDDQLGYYVAQAREVIDLCLGSQKQVLDALQGTAAHG